MNSRSLLLLSLFFLLAFTTQAQRTKKNKKEKTENTEETEKVEKKKKTKAEKTEKKPKKDKKSDKQLKEEMREYYYDIEKYEQAKYEIGDAKQKADSLDNVLSSMKKSQDENREAIDRLSLQREETRNKIKELEDKNNSAERKSIPSEGTFFSIQIGAFSKRNISHLIDNKEGDLSVEIEENGVKKYLLGGYKTYEDAAVARKKIRQMGAKDAWIVSYKDGKRVPMTEVRTKPIPDEELKQLKGNR